MLHSIIAERPVLQITLQSITKTPLFDRFLTGFSPDSDMSRGGEFGNG